LLYDPGTGEIHRAGPADVDGLENQLRTAVSQGASFSDIDQNRFITAVRLGAQPLAGLAPPGARMPGSVLQGIANLVAIGPPPASNGPEDRTWRTRSRPPGRVSLCGPR